MKNGFVFGFVGTLVKFLFPHRLKYVCDIPQDGAMVICSNHLSCLDFFFVREAAKRHVCFMAKKEIFNNRLIKYFADKLNVIPVDRNTNDVRAVINALKVLKSNKVLGIFPEGTRKRKNPEGNYHEGVAVFAIRTGAPVIPVRLIAKNDKIRIFKKFDIVIGKPIYFSDTDNVKESASKTMSAIYSL